MKFSVLMAVYHKENPEYLKFAIDSILNQTKKPNQIVIVKDGPLTKELESVLNKYESNKIFKIINIEINQGLGNALRTGLLHCDFEFVARMDSDDYSVPTRFEEQFKFLELNDNVDILGSNMGEFNNRVGDIESLRIVKEKDSDIKKRLLSRNAMNHISVVFRKSKIFEIGSYESVLYLEDYYLWAKASINNLVFHNIQKTLVYARIGNGMYERRGNKQQVTGWKKIQKLFLKHNLVSKIGYFIHMTQIRVFLITPPFIKKILYNLFFRKKKEV